MKNLLILAKIIERMHINVLIGVHRGTIAQVVHCDLDGLL